MTPRSAPESSSTQRSRILSLLISARGGWVSLPEIAALACQYNSRLLDLRRLGFRIENRTKEVDGARHSWYRLVSNPVESAPSTTPVAGSNERSFPARQQELFPHGDRSVR